MSAAAVLAGFGADLAVGDPRRGHPVSGFGTLALALERRIYRPTRLRGAAFTALLVGGVAAAAELLARALPRRLVLAAATWAALGGRSLRSEAMRVEARVTAGDIDGARAALPSLCGRDPSCLDAGDLRRATVESLAENTGDAVVGALLWGAVAGPAGVVAYRAANTLDAMVGHRSARYERFGWAAARLDDVLSWPAARAGAGLACLAAPLVGGSPAAAWRITRRDGGAHPSPNAGRLEAAFAGALGLRLGGPLRYGDRAELRPALGEGRPAAEGDVARAARLSLAVGVLSTVLAAAARGALRR